ncbi:MULTISPECIES: hypothetical protein [unclassified Streptomyces]|uniref:hypothetical protein n=1 Tax=unclassified Streptomyces TaxID=2593676 RepID=UPI00081D6275|nr:MULTISPECIES: hypothetical protein [unclassified Streptomyces]MYZ34576.1 hypothetical protein [Streptomyces sp. SID4917]SCF68397.1 hypothetical protein GA0115259_100989 [Streptomyces sp. MnatMP-M17]
MKRRAVRFGTVSGEDHGEPRLSFSPSLNPYLLGAFVLPVAETICTVLQTT